MRLEMKRLEFAFKNGLEYYLPEERSKMTGIEKTRAKDRNTAVKSRVETPEVDLNENEIQDYMKYYRKLWVSKSRREPIKKEDFTFIDIERIQ